MVCAVGLVILVITACSPTPEPAGPTGGDSVVGDPAEWAATKRDGADGRPAASGDGSQSVPDELLFDADPGDDSDEFVMDRLRLALVRPESMLPARLDRADRSAVVVADLLYDGLTTFDVDHGAVGPGLARRWSSDDDFDRWEFELDATAGIGVDDVMRTFTALSESADPLAARTSGNVTMVSGDAGGIVIELGRPDPDFPAAISGVAFSIVGVAVDGSLGLPTGRFTIISNDRNGMVLRSDNRDEDGRPIGVAEIVITWVDDADDAYDQLTLGLADAAPIDRRQMEDARSRFAEPFPTANTARFLVVSPKSSALATVAARSAFAATVDLSDLVANGTEAGMWVRRDSIRPGPYGGAGDDDGDIDSCDGVAGCDPSRSPNGARPLVRRTVTVGFSDEAGQDMAQRVATDLRSAGWVVDLAPVPAGLGSEVADSDVDIVVVDQAWPWPSGVHALAALTGPDRFLTDVEINGEPVAETVAEAMSVDNAVERAAAVASIEDKLVESGWVIPIARRRSMLARSPLVQQFGLTFDGSLDLAD